MTAGTKPMPPRPSRTSAIGNTIPSQPTDGTARPMLATAMTGAGTAAGVPDPQPDRKRDERRRDERDDREGDVLPQPQEDPVARVGPVVALRSTR